MYSIVNDVDVLRSTFERIFESNSEEILKRINQNFIVMIIQEDETIFGSVERGRLIMHSIYGCHEGTKKMAYMWDRVRNLETISTDFIVRTLHKYRVYYNQYNIGDGRDMDLRHILVEGDDSAYVQAVKRQLRYEGQEVF